MEVFPKYATEGSIEIHVEHEKTWVSSYSTEPPHPAAVPRLGMARRRLCWWRKPSPPGASSCGPANGRFRRRAWPCSMPKDRATPNVGEQNMERRRQKVKPPRKVWLKGNWSRLRVLKVVSKVSNLPWTKTLKLDPEPSCR